jgi:hypothetical protein
MIKEKRRQTRVGELYSIILNAAYDIDVGMRRFDDDGRYGWTPHPPAADCCTVEGDVKTGPAVDRVIALYRNSYVLLSSARCGSMVSLSYLAT